jgi:hypothetical protein
MPTPLVVERILWFLPVFLQVSICVFMVRRKLYGELPWFFAYGIFEPLESTVSFFVRHQMPLYFYFYWITEFVSVAFGLAIIYEVFKNLVTRYERVQKIGLWLYRCCAGLLLLIATATVAMAPDINTQAMFEGIVTLERGLRFMQAGLLVFLFAFASYLGLSWRNCSFGVALGFGFLASVELALAAIRSHIGNHADQIYVVLKSIAFNLSTAIWLAYLLLPQREAKPVTSIPKHDLAVWDNTLTELVRR